MRHTILDVDVIAFIKDELTGIAGVENSAEGIRIYWAPDSRRTLMDVLNFQMEDTYVWFSSGEQGWRFEVEYHEDYLLLYQEEEEPWDNLPTISEACFVQMDILDRTNIASRIEQSPFYTAIMNSRLAYAVDRQGRYAQFNEASIFTLSEPKGFINELFDCFEEMITHKDPVARKWALFYKDDPKWT